MALQGLRTRLRPIHGRVRQFQNRSRSTSEIWTSALGQERDYWAGWLAHRGIPVKRRRVGEAFSFRIDPGSELQPPLSEVVDRLPDRRVSILDVGAGPLSTVGKVHPGKQIDLTAVDPLAPEYDHLLERAGIEPPIRTVPGKAEELVEQFGTDRFNVAFADNALDHSADPLSGIENMLSVVRPGGYVVLRHALREAERNHYLGLHQWNFDVDGDQPILWNRRVRHNLARCLAQLVRVDCRVQPDGLVCVLQKGSVPTT